MKVIISGKLNFSFSFDKINHSMKIKTIHLSKIPCLD